MTKYKEFPYPSQKFDLIVYGRKGCNYCEKTKKFINYMQKQDKVSYIYHDIFEIIDSGQAKDINDFKKKMKPFIGDFSTVPMIFIGSNFHGGYDTFCDIILKIKLGKTSDDKEWEKIRKIFLKDSEKNNETKNLKKKILEKLNKSNKCEAVKKINNLK